MTTTKKEKGKRIELSLCRSCYCMTWTISTKGLFAPEYKCEKCGFKKELNCMKKINGAKK